MWQELDDIIEESIKKGFPSAQIMIEKSGEIVKKDKYGHSLLIPEVIKSTDETLYDIASLTKVFSLTYAFQYLTSREEVDLNCTLAQLIPEAFTLDAKIKDSQRSVKGEITIAHLLSHQAGFEPNPLFYDWYYSEALYCQGRAKFLDKLLLAPLIHSPGTKALYSDVDYMLLTFIFERLVGESLECWLQTHFWEPLNIELIGFNPLKRFLKEMIAGTELKGNSRDGVIRFENMRQTPIWGEVQDEKAYHCMDGISGHAGLFANSKSLLSLLELMYDKRGFFADAVKTQFLTGSANDSSFGLGWRLNRRDGLQFMFGDYASASAYGHTGWTGCLVLRDPEYELSIIYLTNRKHTKVIDPARDSNLFLGDQLPAGKYRIIVNKIYETLGLN